MSQEVSEELRGLIKQFVQTYCSVVDLELDETLAPNRWFMPLNSYVSKKEASHYFLLSAALSDYKLTGNPRNIRMLLHHLHETLQQKLYTSKNPSDFTYEVMKYEQDIRKLDQLGEAKEEIPDVLCSVNRFVEKEAHGDLVQYTTKLNQKGLKPKDLVEDFSYNVKRMNKHHKSKSWLYLRWLVRPSPDLAIFSYNSKDLMVALTTPKLRVCAALGLAQNENLAFELNAKKRPESWWKDTAEFDADTASLSNFAASLFPNDPAKVDFPFFILGTWLEYADLTEIFLQKSLRFLTKKYLEMGQPIMRYLTVVSHYNKSYLVTEPGPFTGLEREAYDYLKKKDIMFNYEPLEFRLLKANSSGPKSYKPDFLILRYTDIGRKVLIETHGIWDNLKEFLDKLRLFKQNYGEFFCLILIVPDDLAETINKLDKKHESYDILWKQSEYKTRLENFRRS